MSSKMAMALAAMSKPPAQKVREVTATAKVEQEKPSEAAGKFVPSQEKLVRAVSVEIQILTCKSIIGSQADPEKLRYVLCAGWKNKEWTARLTRLSRIVEAAPLVEKLKKHWQLVEVVTWGMSSNAMTAALVASYCGKLDKLPPPPQDEWRERFLNSEQFMAFRERLEKESGRPEK